MATMSLQDAYDQTRRWIESNDPERAIGLAQHIIKSYPRNLEAYRILGEAYLASRQLDQAQEAFEHVLRSDPENIPAHVGLGITYERQGKLDRAVPEFEQAWEIKPEMVELRSQLLRLYSEAWGSEHAQLRLSKAGLARLYAKGHMLPQAISEFRKVIADQPNRQDARVALAEALWRDGEESEAIAMARDILNTQPDSLKANLLLGFLYLAQGRPEGQQYWDEAVAIDPQMTVAQAMFDTLPSQPSQEQTLPVWDEQEWRRKLELERQPVPAATRPIVIAEPAVVAASQPNFDDFLSALLAGGAVAAASAPPPTAPEETEEDMFSFDEPFEPEHIQPSTPASNEEESLAPFSLSDLGLSDDEVAAFGETESQPTTSTSSDDEPEMTPFSLSDLGLSDDEVAAFGETESQPTASTSSDDEPEMTPFSFSDLGLTDDEIATLGGETPSADSAFGSASSSDDEPEMTPFSFSDLGLTDDEISSLGGETPSADSAFGSASSSDDEPEMTPFSLSDLGLTDDEIATFGESESQPTANTSSDDEPEMTPFSLSDLGLTDDEISSLGGETPSADSTFGSASSDDEPEMTPFSLSDLGLTDDEIATFGEPESQPTANTSSDDEPEITPFSLSDLGLSDDEIASLNSAAEPANDDDISSMSPFSLSDLGLSDDEIASLDSANEPAAKSDADISSMSPFSLSDLGLSDDEIASLDSATESSSNDDSILGMSPFSLSDLGLSDDEIASLNSANAADTARADDADTSLPDDLMPFSLDDLDINSASSQLPPSLQPFSLEDAPPIESPRLPPMGSSFEPPIAEEDTTNSSGGYSWQQPSQRSRPSYINSGPDRDPLMPAEGESIFSKLKQRKERDVDSQPPIEQPAMTDELDDRMIFSLDDVPLREDADQNASTPQFGAQSNEAASFEDLGDAISAGQIQPFSLSELGLNADEIAALGVGSNSGVAQSFSSMLGDTPATEETAPANQQVLPAEDVELAEPTSTAPVVEEEETSELESLSPFSLSDLGLSDDEIAALGLEESHDDTSGLGLTEEELAGLDMGGDIDLSLFGTSAAEEPVEEEPEVQLPPVSSEPEFNSGDPLLDRLMMLGRGQGYVDIADIIEGVENPEAEADRIEQIGQILHQNNIKIFDGEEEIDMDAEYEEDDSSLSQMDFGGPAATNDEPEMTPFSLSDLGLSDDEIASLGLGAEETPAAPATPTPPANDEPEMTPFSLSDLGLSDDEIASLGLGSSAPAAPSEPEAPSDEPEMTPFSLSDLGLSDDEIASLGLGSNDAPAAPAQNPELDIAPFSLDDIAPIEEPAAPVAPPTPPEPVAPVQQPVVSSAPANDQSLVQPRRSPGLSNSLAEQVPALSSYLQRLESEPQNHPLRLSLARISGQIGQIEAAIQQYRNIIRQNVMLDSVADDISDLISDTDDTATLMRLHRLLGDVYSKQGLIEQAISEYNWTYNN